jgi:dolichyl-phosphate-mannose-protein mannosyltransferase
MSRVLRESGTARRSGKLAPLTPQSSGEAAPRGAQRERLLLVLSWVALAAVLTWLASRDLDAPGGYYDEALYGHLAKDFLAGRAGHPHLPGSRPVELLGRPFPLFVQGYLGALKCWMLLPGIAGLGASVAAMRLTMLAWTLAGLLLCLLWARRLLGLPAAVLATFLLALDPSFYFVSVCDWGAVVPSYVCRFAVLYFTLRWWQGGRARDLFLAGLAAGLGFFNKIDFAVALAGYGGAALLAGGGQAWRGRLRRAVPASDTDRADHADVFGPADHASSAKVAQGLRPAHLAWGVAGLLLGAAPMVWTLPEIARGLAGGRLGTGPGQAAEKLHIFLTMLDGTYFYRLMEQGGQFGRMYSTPALFRSPFGLLAAAAFAFLAVEAARRWRHAPDRPAIFLLLSTALILLGTAFLPGAVRIHHWTLVYPLPHLLLAAAATRAWRRPAAAIAAGAAIRALPRIAATAAVATALGGHLLALQATQRLIAETGGRGLWSNALDAFAEEVRNRRDLTLVSWDWGFHESLAFLTDGPRLLDPTWSILTGRRFPVPAGRNVIHLVHPPEYQVLASNAELLALASAAGPAGAEVREYDDRQGRPAFYTVRFLGGAQGGPAR